MSCALIVHVLSTDGAPTYAGVNCARRPKPARRCECSTRAESSNMQRCLGALEPWSLSLVQHLANVLRSTLLLAGPQSPDCIDLMLSMRGAMF